MNNIAEIYIDLSLGEVRISKNIPRFFKNLIRNIFVSTDKVILSQTPKLLIHWKKSSIRMFENRGQIGTFQRWKPLNPKWAKRKIQLGGSNYILRFKKDLIYKGVLNPNISLMQRGPSSYRFIIDFPLMPYYGFMHLKNRRSAYSKWFLPKRDWMRWDSKIFDEVAEDIKEQVLRNIDITIDKVYQEIET